MATSFTTTTTTRRFTWQSRYSFLLVLLIAAFLRFYALDASSLWSDEGNTYVLILRSFGEIARDAAADIHPPGYYWLLKVWSGLFGASAATMRAFSALLGVALVAVVFAIGRQLNKHTDSRANIALTAAMLAALNPFQVYYSQEARMYMLLALAGAGLFWALLMWIERESNDEPVTAPLLAFVLWGALGLWTHYSFPILLCAAGLAYLWHWRTLLQAHRQPTRAIMRYTLANLVVVLTFAPWLSIAIRRVLAWPQGGEPTPFSEGVLLTFRTLLFGSLRDLPEPVWPWLLMAALLPLVGIVALTMSPMMQGSRFVGDTPRAIPLLRDTTGGIPYRQSQGITLALWLFAPIALMFALGLFSDAFLKFLLTASPAWTLLCAAVPLLLPQPRWGAALLIVVATIFAALTLPPYYTSPTARDNYAGVATYIEAVSDDGDLVILDAPGQGDVWSYYSPGLLTLGVPQSRPPDPAETVALLEDVALDRHQIFALFWATDEADPDKIVESWLDQHAFRGLERWQGNLRFVVYTMTNQLECRNVAPPVPFGEHIQLTALCQPTIPQRIPAGQAAIVALRWQTQQTLSARYKVTVQLLDARSQVIAQHDAEPGGGSLPTDSWQINTPITDNHGLTIPFGAPPGDYRLIVALYDEANGERLATPTGDAYELGTIEVVRPESALPLALIPMLQRADAQLGPVMLVGYDAYKKDHSHAPETPLQAGDVAHFTLYWQAPDPLLADWPDDLHFTLTLGGQSISAPLAGGAYPTSSWQAGEFVRGEFDLPFDGSDITAAIEINGNRHTLNPLPR